MVSRDSMLLMFGGRAEGGSKFGGHWELGGWGNWGLSACPSASDFVWCLVCMDSHLGWHATQLRKLFFWPMQDYLKSWYNELKMSIWENIQGRGLRERSLTLLSVVPARPWSKPCQKKIWSPTNILRKQDHAMSHMWPYCKIRSWCLGKPVLNS